ncbi:MAG: hypothetical protein NVS3B26_28740 [Mycobacteriales bacterium]
MTPRWLTALCLTTTLLPLSLGAVTTAASAGSTVSDSHDGFLTPFREDGAHYDAATNTFSGGFAKGARTDANGCVPQTDPTKNTGAPTGNPNAYDCLPAGASMVQLANGHIAFWNALEGEEAVTGTNTLLTDGGRLTVNDESRDLNLSGSKPVFVAPSPVDAGAHQTSHPDDLPLGPFSAKHYSYNNGSMFCSDQVLLGDGSVIDVGGTDYYQEPYLPVVDKGVVELEGVRNTRIYDPSSKSWTAGPVMNHGRWYPALVTLGNGNLFVASGVQKLLKPAYPTHPAESGTNVKQSETLDLGSKKWVENGPSADKSLPLFPRLHLLPDGHVYYDAAGQDFNPAGQSYDEALWTTASSYNPVSKTWTDLGVPGTDPAYLAANPQAAPFAGFRGSTFSAALTMRPAAVKPDGTPVYTSSSFLTAGGVLGASPGSYVAVANSRITTVDTAGGTETMKTVGTGDLHQGRWYGTATPLPNGQVFVTSGANVDEVDAPGSESPIRTTELFTPQLDSHGGYTGGTWQVVGSQARKRTYHNNAVLRPDGSVLIGGHAPIATGYYQTTDSPDLPGRDGTNNHHDASFQTWQPPYVNDPARPAVDGVSPDGARLVVHTTDAASIASVVLMRNTAETHLVDGDARTVALPVLARNPAAGTVTVGVPASTNVLPNGPYMLFANKSRSGNVKSMDPTDLLPSAAEQLFVVGAGRDTTPSIFIPRAARPTSAALHRSAVAGGLRDASSAHHRRSNAHLPISSSRGGADARPTTTRTSLDLASDRRSVASDVPPSVLGLLLVAGAGVLARRRWSLRRR